MRAQTLANSELFEFDVGFLVDVVTFGCYRYPLNFPN